MTCLKAFIPVWNLMAMSGALFVECLREDLKVLIEQLLNRDLEFGQLTLIHSTCIDASLCHYLGYQNFTVHIMIQIKESMNNGTILDSE